MGLGQFGTKDD
jgi:hypothetical protein